MSDHKTRFVVFTTQRTGSTWLMSVLNNQDGVSGQGELFLPRPRSQERRWDSEFAWPRYVESRACDRVLQRVRDLFVQGKKNAKQALDDAAAEWNKILAAAK